MKHPSKEHMTMYGPIYAILTLVLGGGSLAKITDNLPVTSIEFINWQTTHTSQPHAGATEAIDLINGRLDGIELTGIRAELKQAYADKCVASGAALEYIDREITRLRKSFKRLTGENYDPQPCIGVTEKPV